MRDLTKSVTSYTWAMSVFWTQQMFNFLGLGGSGSWDRSARAFQNVTEATANEMGDTMRGVFRSGDTLQRGMVDLFLAPFSLGNWAGGSRGAGDRGGSDRDGNGGRGTADWNRGGGGERRTQNGDRGGGWVDAAARAAQAGADVMQATADTTARTTRRAADAMTNQQPQRGAAPRSADPSLGWGPMPR